MGADLYIGESEAEEDYFRDSYNNTSLMGRLGLSWPHVLEVYGDQDATLQPARVAELLQAIEDIELSRAQPKEHPMAALMRQLAGMEGLKVVPPTEYQLHYEYFATKKADFEAFLRRAIKANLPIHCSI